MKRSRPNQYSLKRIEKLNAEFPERVKLIERCGGHLRVREQIVRRNDGTKHMIRHADCIGGSCESCGKWGTAENGGVHPHEIHPRGHWENGKFGSVSTENSLMVCNECHDKLQNRSPRFNWLKP